MKTSSTLFGLILPVLSIAASVPLVPHRHSHDGELGKRLPSSWYHPPDHPAYALFRRGVQTDGTTYAAVGSSEWSDAYPPSKPDPSEYPQAWVDALNAAVQAGKIPDIPPSTMNSNGLPEYPDGLDATGSEVCSATYKCQNSTTDIWDAPDGVFGAGFDDGPLPTSVDLYKFLHDNNVRATHFMIGVNILENPDEFTMAFETNNDDIAVHTWTHPYMTTLDNMQLLGEFGWTMQIIHNSTGGRLPRYWRPPYGDADNRVRAIAQEIFGLTTIVWNHDTEDWSLTTGGTTPDEVHSSLEKWLTGPKSPGLIILEHELSNQSVQAFINAFPLIGQNGWNIVSVTELNGSSPYQNSDSSTGTVQPDASILALSGTNSSELINTSSSVTTSQASNASSTASLTPTSTSTTSHPAVTNLGAQTQSPSSSALRLDLSWGTLELVTAFAVISAGVSLI